MLILLLARYIVCSYLIPTVRSRPNQPELQGLPPPLFRIAILHFLHQVRLCIIFVYCRHTHAQFSSCISYLIFIHSTIVIRNDLYEFDTGVTRRRFLDVLVNDSAAPGRGALFVDSARVLSSGTRRKLQDSGYTCDVSGNRRRVRFTAVEDFEGTARCEYTACDRCKCGTALIVITVRPAST